MFKDNVWPKWSEDLGMNCSQHYSLSFSCLSQWKCQNVFAIPSFWRSNFSTKIQGLLNPSLQTPGHQQNLGECFCIGCGPTPRMQSWQMDPLIRRIHDPKNVTKTLVVTIASWEGPIPNGPMQEDPCRFGPQIHPGFSGQMFGTKNEKLTSWSWLFVVYRGLYYPKLLPNYIRTEYNKPWNKNP